MIRKPLQRWFRNLITLLVLSYWYPGFHVSGGLRTLIVAALLLLAIQLFLQPLLKILFIPINVITLGMFHWVLEVVHLLILFFFLPGVQFSSFSYDAFKILGLQIPAGDMNIFMSVIVGSILYKFLRKVVLFLT